MGVLFQNVLRASRYGSIVIAAVLLLRLVLNKAPKKYVCLLWVLAGLRLLMPLDIESTWSLQPDVGQITQSRMAAAPTQMQTPVKTPAVPEDTVLPEDAEVVYGDAFVASAPNSAAVDEIPVVVDYAAVAAWIWLAVACGMGVYSAVSYLRLKRRVRDSVILSEGVWECPGIDTAFILGYLWPRIYLPVG